MAYGTLATCSPLAEAPVTLDNVLLLLLLLLLILGWHRYPGRDASHLGQSLPACICYFPVQLACQTLLLLLLLLLPLPRLSGAPAT